MKTALVITLSFGCVVASLGTGCGMPTPARDAAADAAKRPPMTTAPAVRSAKGPTPPMSATSTGMVTRPPIAPNSSIMVPVTNQEVFQFMCTPEGVTAPITCNWAYDSMTMRNYVWWTQPTACVTTGANADAAVLVEINADGSGSFLLGSTCSDLNLAGCMFDPAGTLGVCGLCSVADTGLISCAQ